MREILFRGQTACGKKEWVYGGIWQTEENDKLTIIFQREPYEELPVYAETVGQHTGLIDKNGTKIFEGDIVKLFDIYGEVIQIDGAFGILIKDGIDYDYLASEIETITGCRNSPAFCGNDNFISLWELMWNYNQEENCCGVVEVIGNIYDNPELR